MNNFLKHSRKLNKFAQVAAVSSFAYIADNQLYDSTFERSIRTLSYGLLISLDYKLNFSQSNAQQIDALHKRSAERIAHVCRSNGGLYIKFGQQIASLNHILPLDYAKVFFNFFDNAPSSSFSDVVKICKKEFGKHPNEMFLEFDEHPIASASIAQVHRAKLPDGTQVAVKIQKPEIDRQMVWDLRINRLVTFLFEKVFNLPIYWTVDYVESHFREEIDFINEAENSRKASSFASKDPYLVDNVYIPRVYDEYTSKRVLTMEWIEGFKFR